MDRVNMINWITGTDMSVPVELVDKYLAAGHRLAEAPVEEPVEEPPEEPTAEPPEEPRKPRSSKK